MWNTYSSLTTRSRSVPAFGSTVPRKPVVSFGSVSASPPPLPVPPAAPVVPTVPLRQPPNGTRTHLPSGAKRPLTKKGEPDLRGGPYPNAGRKPGTGKAYQSARSRLVSEDIGIALQEYGVGGTPKLEAQIATLQKTRRLMKAGFNYESVKILMDPVGVGKRGEASEATPAQISAAPELIGQTPQEPDPLSAEALKVSQMTTSPAEVSPAAMNLTVGHQSSGASVPSSQTPAMVMQLELAGEEGLPVRSLFSRG